MQQKFSILFIIFLSLLIFLFGQFTTKNKVQAQKIKQLISTSTIASQNIMIDIPFTVQAPLANWKDARQQDACEEASVLMAIYWARGKKPPKPKLIEQEIITISEYELKKYNNYRDTSAEDTVKIIFKGYYNFQKAEAKKIKSSEEIINELKAGNAVIVPVNGQKLKNPYYTPPGPERHMLLIKGYDGKTNEFITNDTGTRRGNNYRYKKSVLEQALRDYLTGNKKPIKQIKKAMIVVRPE